MKTNRRDIRVVELFVLLLITAALTIAPTAVAAEKPAAATKEKAAAATKDDGATPGAAPATAAANPHAAHTMDMTPAQSTPLIRRGMKMHVQHWATLPTGSSSTAVTPLDPNTIPKFVNQLTRPATF